MTVITQVKTGGTMGILIALTLIFLISPAMLTCGFWLLGLSLALTLKTYLALVVFTLWLVFMTHFT